MNFQEKLLHLVEQTAADTPAKAAARFSKATALPVTFRTLNDGHNPRGVILQACASGEPGLYQEMSVSLHLPDGKRLVDILIGLSPDKDEVRILVSADGDGDGEKPIAVYPERAAREAVESHA